MAIISLRTSFPGQNYQVPRLVHINSNDTEATATAAGYLNNYMIMNQIALYTSDFVALASSNGTQWYKPVFTNGTPQNGGSVQLVALS